MSSVQQISELEFLDLKVPIYQDLTGLGHPWIACWKSRNPDSFYQGYMYLNHATGKVTYPPDAVIPEQTERDREMIPKFVVTTQESLSEEDLQNILKYLTTEHQRRNGKSLHS